MGPFVGWPQDANGEPSFAAVGIRRGPSLVIGGKPGCRLSLLREQGHLGYQHTPGHFGRPVDAGENLDGLSVGNLVLRDRDERVVGCAFDLFWEIGGEAGKRGSLREGEKSRPQTPAVICCVAGSFHHSSGQRVHGWFTVHDTFHGNHGTADSADVVDTRQEWLLTGSSTIFTIFEGTSEIQRMLIGRTITGLDVR